MTRPLTAQIKPSTRNALMDQLALAANTIIEQREAMRDVEAILRKAPTLGEYLAAMEPQRRWWQVWRK